MVNMDEAPASPENFTQKMAGCQQRNDALYGSDNGFAPDYRHGGGQWK